MLLKKLVFDNYKTYYGLQDVDLYIPPEEREKGKNIILLGGLNGAGKTTILKAILYVLFGKRGISESEHKRLFSNVINNTFFEEGGRSCSVTLVLETDQKEEWELKVRWGFDYLKRLTHEERSILVKRPGIRQGKKVQIDNIEVYNRFIDKIIPYHSAPFFIFDGEEIKDIILRQNSSEMTEAIHKITGMQAYNQLLDDLDKIIRSLEQDLSRSVSKSKLSNINNELEKVEEEIKTLREKKETRSKELDGLKSQIETVKNQRNNKLKNNSRSREELIKRQSSIDAKLQNMKTEFRNLFLNEGVNTILNSKINTLKKQLRNEQALKNKRVIASASLTPYHDFINKLLSEPIDPPLNEQQLNQIKEIGEGIWMKDNDIKEVEQEAKELHDLSTNTFNYLTNIQSNSSEKYSSKLTEIDRLTNQLESLESELRNAPESVDISNENKQIDDLTRSLGEKEVLFKSTRRKLKVATESRTALTSQLTKLKDQGSDYEDVVNQLETVKKLYNVVSGYIEKMTELKANYIKEEFSNMLTKLFRKKDEFGKIEFDIRSYTVKLYSDQMQEISIQDRSAGEMQMISSALIWALTKASDLSLPMVIDTPLGRLDSFHRNHLINHYYKELSEQVIILSTDTEITKDYVDFMKEHSHKQYMLDYDEDKKYTVIRKGYFDLIKV
ncbi:DNA sulfur modification protein DndD [Guptibacillus algicola]|uniref:DNA sulfur modification protein DndD n=1 Tax=Guptibacillus algicola TaxID=225844 RepID=UPI001CD1E8A9|nr:DNA sulfur modification protein DndD [Alkalihalobacillus algicola]MCA0987273.1 DNA sulfur modification protein DndD [Alkalihalobacillus algicola]